MSENLFKVKKFQFVIFNPLSYCFEEMIGFDVKALFASRPVSRLTGDITRPDEITTKFWILRKRYSVPRDFSWIDNYKLIYWRQRLLRFILLPLCRFSDTDYLHHASKLPNWDKSDRIFKEIILVTSKAEEKIQKCYFHYSGNFDKNTKRPHEGDPPRIRRVIKKYKSKLFELIAWHLEVPTSH